jgi:tetratricopeptide (TPR) repeat protein/mono/diheme cytochrome c family protein
MRALRRLACPAPLGGWAVITLLASPVIGRAQLDEQDLAAKAHKLFQTHCYRCHGQDGANEGGVNYILDRDKLVERRKVLPGQPDKSRLFKRLTSPDDPMPPAEEKVRPGSDDISLVRTWIAAGAPGAAATPANRAFVPPAELLKLIHADLDKVPDRSRRFTRYFTLTHLANAGLSADELQSYRHALAKLVNSLSWDSRIVVPQPIDPAGTILRIDLRDYQWNEKTWEAVLAVNPYGVAAEMETAQDIYAATQCRQPYVRGDWFVAAASRPPLYHDVLRLPATLRELEKLLRFDAAENIRQEKVVRAGFNSSGVSRNNRLIERHESGGVVYWISYDFAGNVGRQNLFAHPLGPGDGESFFRHDGGEVIFSLPNGLQAYLLADATGRRIDKGPQAIVSDPRRPDRAVENGISCMSCHVRGMIFKDDQVRPHVMENPAAFTREDRDAILALYPPRERLAALLEKDARRFQDAVARTGAPLSASEPVVALALHFEAEMSLRLVAAEAGVAPDALLRALDVSPRLAKHLGVLRVPGATIQRQVFAGLFAEMARVLKLGEFLRPRNTPGSLALARGDELLDGGDMAGALKAYAEAIEHEPENPLARMRRAGALHDKGELDQALADYDEALRLDPRNPVALNNRGLAHFDRRQVKRAIADYDAALRLDPEYAIAYQNRGQAHVRLGAYAQAIADFGHVLELRPNHVPALLGRGAARHGKKDYDGAVADFTEAIRLDPKSAVAFNNRGLALYEKEDFARAIDDFTEAIRLDGKLARAYYNRALSHLARGDEEAARLDRERALQLDPTLEKK